MKLIDFLDIIPQDNAVHVKILYKPMKRIDIDGDPYTIREFLKGKSCEEYKVDFVYAEENKLRITAIEDGYYGEDGTAVDEVRG